MAEVAKLVKTIPASGEDASEYLPVVLYFDKEPLAVTVEGLLPVFKGIKRFGVFRIPIGIVEISYFILNGRTPMAPRMLVHI